MDLPTAANKQLVGERPLRLQTLNSIQVGSAQTFELLLEPPAKPAELAVTISTPALGLVEHQLEWLQGAGGTWRGQATFRPPLVGLYTVHAELTSPAAAAHEPQQPAGSRNVQFQAKAYDPNKVFIKNSPLSCRLGDSYEFSVDASEAGEGQLEIAVNEGDIPNQVRVFDNGKCVVNFVPEYCVAHLVDIKFNGHDVLGCPFQVAVLERDQPADGAPSEPQPAAKAAQQLPEGPPSAPTLLVSEEPLLVNTGALIRVQNLRLEAFERRDLLLVDPDGQPVAYKLSNDPTSSRPPSVRLEFVPQFAGDYTLELAEHSALQRAMSPESRARFPIALKVFDHTKVIVSHVTDGVVGHPIYFFIDASQAGSGNLEIRVSSNIRNVPNHPESETNARIRVHFTPTEPVEHSIEVKFNGVQVPGNPFLVRVAAFPCARLPVTCLEQLKSVAVEEPAEFYIDVLAAEQGAAPKLEDSSCQVHVLHPDLSYTRLQQVALEPGPARRFKVRFTPAAIGPHKLFVCVLNQLLPGCPVLSNAFNTGQVRVQFGRLDAGGANPVGELHKPVAFSVDASRAGEGTLALAVVSGLTKSLVHTEVKVSERSHGLYELTFVPVEFAPHSIDMSFNERIVPKSPFVVDILDAAGNSSLAAGAEPAAAADNEAEHDHDDHRDDDHDDDQLVQDFGKLAVEQPAKTKPGPKTLRKSLAFGLVGAANIVYLEAGVLEAAGQRVRLLGPDGQPVPFSLARGSPGPGEPKRYCIRYQPASIGTHTISVQPEARSAREYSVQICDPARARLQPADTYVAGRRACIRIDTRQSGELQLDSVRLVAEGRPAPLEHSLSQPDEHSLELSFVAPLPGPHSLELRCLGQPLGQSPFRFQVLAAASGARPDQAPEPAGPLGALLEAIVVHGVSLRCSPVNSTGAFIIETGGLAQARDFDVLITDPSRGPVDVQCYLQQDGNLLAEWTPRRVGTHQIQVLYRDQHVLNSPFSSQTFDPSAVLIEGPRAATVQLEERVELRLRRRGAGAAELDVAITSPLGQHLPIQVEPLARPASAAPQEPQPSQEEEEEEEAEGELVWFVPSVPGSYKVAVTFGGYEVPRSPLTVVAREPRAQPDACQLSGPGLVAAELAKTAHFQVDTRGAQGELKLRIECGEREIVPKLERRNNLCTVRYKPTELGYANISVYWNGAHAGNSPFSVPVLDLGKLLFLSGTNKASNTSNQRYLQFEPHQPKELTLDTSRCGPGQLQAEAYCRPQPHIKFALPVHEYLAHRFRVLFSCPPPDWPQSKGAEPPLEATYVIRFHYGGLAVPEPLASVVVSPASFASRPPDVSSLARASKAGQPEPPAAAQQAPAKQQRAEPEGPVVTLRGHGLAEAKRGQRAEFTIDGSRAGPGQPEVRLLHQASGAPVPVQLEPTGPQKYLASYRLELLENSTSSSSSSSPPPPPSSEDDFYTLNVLWDGQQVAGCPTRVLATSGAPEAAHKAAANGPEPHKVLCSGDGLKGGVLGEEIKVFIDTRRAGAAELTALCAGRQLVAFCELLDRADGTFVLYIKPQEAGRHSLSIRYAGQHIAGSPFAIKVSGRPDPSRVHVHGPGVEHGVLSLYQSRFVCDTKGAGAGQLTVRIRGPKGAFRMETQRESERNRRILCKYDPTEPGDYRIEIKWSGQHVPGSPFLVMIFDTQEELNRYLGQATLARLRPNGNSNAAASHNNLNNNINHNNNNNSHKYSAGQPYASQTPLDYYAAGQPPFRLQ